MTPGRRSLSFASLDEVMPDVEHLLEGHSTLGHWSLGQICQHLAVALRLSMVARPPPVRALGQRIVNQGARLMVLTMGQFPEGVATPVEALIPGPDLDNRAEADALRDALAHFAASPDPFSDHPAFGPMTRDDWARFHCVHCAHHLSFALPNR